ncbi:MAG TPA: ribosome biogenesis GTP-binding protein YihA/YsxC [Thermoanaerobaculia bacterium]|nr:ribosome biogenesis GTP-binding protein YihA/YsxC [Thermoanaerobaculia bacterium]
MKITSAEFVRGAHAPDQMISDDLPRIAFAGRSNVGKSTLINRLLQRKGLARTSSTPGRTRAINYFLVNRRFYFVDLPGYGYAKVSRKEREAWGRLVEAFVLGPGGPLRIVQLIDGKIAGSPLDAEALSYLLGLGADLTVAVTKFDKVPRNKRSRCLADVARLLEAPDSVRILPVSAISGEGISELWQALDLG